MNITDLVNKYKSNREAYLKADYNETQLRTDFLDPFFEMLGWDIKNSSGKPTNEREVLLEEGLKAGADSNTKKPDYTFRLFSERKFFLEAKKPFVKIENYNEPAKQVRRYGFTAKLKISVLSNFEYLAIYDCSHKVEKEDTASRYRVNLYHYTEYESAFDDIKKQLGRQSVYSGNFDEVWKEIEEQLKLSSVDSLFLNQINEWRITLGKEIYSHKPNIREEELNDIVQSYINSIIFLRVCEDRNLEVYKTLLNFAQNDDFVSLLKKFKEADRKYNAGLFSQLLTDKVISDSSSAFWNIIKDLYFPESTYSFSVFASDILGNIYEIFLGEQLVIEHGQILLKKKPENVDRDIVTTPTFIVNDILKQTVSEYCKNKSDKEIIGYSFGDIACGSGAFLLETYQLLQDILVDYYLNNDRSKLIQTSLTSFKLFYQTKKQILENCIFGVDKDYNAVQACKFGLLLKLLENEENSTITSPALPNLDQNIQFGNSLIETTGTNEINQNEINPFDFGKTKFDVIVGNPPYLPTDKMKKFTPLELPIYKTKFKSSFKQFDKYFLFIERGLGLLKEGGFLGYIVPSKFTKVGAGKKLRELLSGSKNIKQIISFGANQVFQNKTTYTCLLILKKNKLENVKYVEVNSIKNWKTRTIDSESFDEFKISSLSSDGWVLYPSILKPVYKSILSQSKPLGELIGTENISNGIQTSANKIYIHSGKKKDRNFTYFMKDGIEWKIENKLTRPYFTTSSGEDNLFTYRPLRPNSFVIYPYLKTKDGIEFIEIGDLKANYPETYKYLYCYKEVLKERDIKPEPETKDEWYRFGRHQSLDKCDVPAKIVVGVLSQGNKYAIDYRGTLISSGGTAGYCMITLPDNFPYSIYYIQALLNSKYLEWFSVLIGEVFRGGYIARGTKVLKKLPIRLIDFEIKSEKEIHNKIAKIQEALIEIQEKIDKTSSRNNRVRIPLQRQFSNKKIELDELLKKLYNLGETDSNIPLISEIYATD